MEHNEMFKHRVPLDSDTIDRLLDGRLDPHDAPPGYVDVVTVVRHAASGFAAAEVDDELLRSMVHAIQTSPAPSTDRKPTMISKRLSAKVATAAAALVLSSAGVAAAAAGNLPGPAQDAVSKGLAHVGVELPTAGDDHPTADDHPTGEDHATGTADNPTDADQHGADVSATAHDTELTGADKGAAVSEVAKAGHGSDDAEADEAVEAGQPAEPGSQAPVVTPNSGGTGTASDASGGKSDVGTSRAPAQAGAGSANAGDHPTASNNPGTSHRR
ncbi:MAG: hypothetical protein Q8K58_10365 [Acidimicrobiales bacterium]|nr:hypothetical protein [Acidimicrobiales bacterium]